MITTKSPLPNMPMPDLALRGMSPALHVALKRAAERNHRSLNGEILVRLEGSLRLSTTDVEELLSRIHARKGRTGTLSLDNEELRDLKGEGRP